MNQKRVIGLLIIIIGGVFLLTSLGIITNGEELFNKYWPLILIIIGVFNLFGARGVKFSGIIMILIGGIFLFDSLGYFVNGVEVWELIVPTIIIVVGINLLLPKGKNKPLSKHYVRQMAFFSGADVLCDSHEFKGADIMTAFGGIDLDLRDIQIGADRPAKIDVFVAFGGVDIIVPEGMSVKVTGLPLFGGWSNKAVKAANVNETDILIHALIMFGGLEVKSRLSN